ncbi:Putative transport protein YhhT [Emticicia aquatica]|uniref:Transport protein YhhT n=1 Tax=Emticicia aquatica TaxID=1681835 RepID=A0ABN8ETK7_9BACT|nr:AI-2E family transporter [Emticicia aquatica]CAH0995971.1 Putative transport protein YhhT [Emticicia aquatica]
MKIFQQPFNARLAYVLISLVIIIYGLHILSDLLIPLTFSGIFALLLMPACEFLERHRLPRWLAISLVICITLGIFSFLFYLVYVQIMDLEEVLPQLTDKAEIWFKKLQIFIRQNFHISRTQQKVEGQKYLTQFLKDNSDIIGNTLSTTTGLLGNLTIIPLYVFLLLLYRDFIRVFFYKVFKSVSSHRVDVVLTKVKDVVINYVVGLGMVIALIGILNTAGLYLLGIEHAIFFGFLASFLVLIPYIGIAIGSLLPILFALITKDSAWYAFGVAALFFTIQMLEGNFITPYIVGTKVSINSMAAIIALIIFGNLWSIGGLVLALPLTAIIKVIFDSIEDLRPYGFLLGDADHIDVEKKRRY